MAASPGWGHGKPGNGPYWTQERIEAAMRKYADDNSGPLTTSDHEWSALKMGRMDLPPAKRVLHHWHSFRSAWLALGVDPSRVKALGTRWTKAEKTYLLEHAGTLTLERIARALHRSYGSVKTMIGSKGFGITARANNGYLSAAQVAKEYSAPYHRVIDLLTVEAIKGFYHPHRNTWQIDPGDLTPEIIAELRKPKTSYRNVPPDLGDYRKRYGLTRTTVRVEATA